MDHPQKKVCIVCTSLNKGGAEKASATQSVIFNRLGYKVAIVMVLSGIAYSYRGSVLDLGKFKNNWGVFNRVYRLIKFKKFLDYNNFDLIVDNRPRSQWYRELIISKLIYHKYPVIYAVHSYEESLAFTKFKWLNTFLYKNEHMLAVSKAGAKKFNVLYGLNKMETVYNAIDIDSIEKQSRDKALDLRLGKYIIYYGRLHNKSKNLKLLLTSFKESKLIAEGIKLLLLGDGEDYEELKAYGKNLNIESYVVFNPFVSNPFPYVKNAIFSVLTSKSEGFALVIAESLSLGVPVVSVNCEAGPKEIIIDRFNGLLVENNNVEAFSIALNNMAFDKLLYHECEKNAKKSVMKFSIENMMKHWENYLSEHFNYKQ